MKKIFYWGIAFLVFLFIIGTFSDDEESTVTNTSTTVQSTNTQESTEEHSQAEEVVEESNDSDGKKQIGESVIMNGKSKSTGMSFKANITITDFGTHWDNIYEQNYFYVSYRIKNIGENTMDVSSTMFDIYVDNKAVPYERLTGENDFVQVVSLAAGREAEGKIFADINPENAQEIDIQLGDTIFKIK